MVTRKLNPLFIGTGPENHFQEEKQETNIKKIMGVLISFTLLTNCSTNLVVDTKGRSGTFNKSTAHQLTDDRIICNQIIKDTVNETFDNTKFLYAKYIELATLGLVKADVESVVQSVSSTDKTVDQSLDGMKLGLGLKKETGFGFIKLEYSETDYDDVSVTTSNSTKVTADIDTDILALSVAKSF